MSPKTKNPNNTTIIIWFILILPIFYIKLKFLEITIKKAYSSEVERTAHNGFVVGSNPTKPNLNETKTKNL